MILFKSVNTWKHQEIWQELKTVEIFSCCKTKIFSCFDVVCGWFSLFVNCLVSLWIMTEPQLA